MDSRPEGGREAPGRRRPAHDELSPPPGSRRRVRRGRSDPRTARTLPRRAARRSEPADRGAPRAGDELRPLRLERARGRRSRGLGPRLLAMRTRVPEPAPDARSGPRLPIARHPVPLPFGSVDPARGALDREIDLSHFSLPSLRALITRSGFRVAAVGADCSRPGSRWRRIPELVDEAAWTLVGAALGVVGHQDLHLVAQRAEPLPVADDRPLVGAETDVGSRPLAIRGRAS